MIVGHCPPSHLPITPMANPNLVPVLCFLFFSISSSLAAREFQPRGFVLPVNKHPSSGQYITHIHQRTPLVPVSLTVDLGGESLWVNCVNNNFISSSYVPVRCNSSDFCFCFTCDGPPRIGCHSPACRMVARNPLRDNMHMANLEIYRDFLGVQSLTDDGRNPGRAVQVKRFQFGCASDESWMFDDLPKSVQGMAGLGKGHLGLPSQLAKSYKFPLIFSICLSSSTKSNGVIFVGGGSYVFLPGVDASKSLMYTPLLHKSFVASMYYRGTANTEYFIGVKGIKVNNKTLPINTTLLSIQEDGVGGTQISTVNNFTLLETSIFNAVTKAFEKELQHVPKVKASPPFKLCYNAKTLGSTRVGPAVPTIDLVMQNEKIFWRIFGSNSMVSVRKDKLCLAFVDGGPLTETAIVIGGHQLEDNLVQFDIKNSRVGFSSSLLSRQTTCSNFNFTSHT